MNTLNEHSDKSNPSSLNNENKDKKTNLPNASYLYDYSSTIKSITKSIVPVYNSFYSNVLPSIIEQIRPSLDYISNSLVLETIKIYNPLQDIIRSVSEMIKPLTSQVVKSLPVMTSYFSGLYETLQKLKENPDNVLNWINFSEKLTSYFWLPPYGMESKELMELLGRVYSEEELDSALELYFSDKIINKLFDEIIEKSFEHHKVILSQMKKSYFNEEYALVNVGLFSIIDSLCSFFLADKRTTYRKNIFQPIIKKEKQESDKYYNILVLSMLNSNINFLYENKDFNKKIITTTHKVAKRHPSQHGQFFSNNKIDTVMLLHTVYYLQVCINTYKDYENRLELIVEKRNNRKYFVITQSKRLEKELVKM